MDFSWDRMVAEGVQMCPFLRNIGAPTSFTFLPSTTTRPPLAPGRGNHGPIFEDGPNFELAFKLFHGRNGVVPLSVPLESAGRDIDSSASDAESSVNFHPLAASAAAISLSAFGASGSFGFDSFMAKRHKMKAKNPSSNKKEHQSDKKSSSFDHEALSNDWLQTGNCPIAKSFRAASGVLPLVAKCLQPPADMKLRCPSAIVAARAALARSAAVKTLRPQPLPTKVLAVGLLGIAINVPLGIWREHTEKFSPAWFTAVHASVPFVAMLRKAVHMPKYALAFTIAASILGQVIGSRAERKRLELIQEETAAFAAESDLEVPIKFVPPTSLNQDGAADMKSHVSSSQQCGKDTHSVINKANSFSDPVGVF